MSVGLTDREAEMLLENQDRRRLSQVLRFVPMVACLSVATAVLGQDAMFIDATGNVGIGVTSPVQVLHVGRTADNVFLAGTLLENTDASPLAQFTGVGFRLQPGTSQANAIDFNAIFVGGGSEFRLNHNDGDGRELVLDRFGNLTITGSLFSTGPTCTGGCDAVFEDGYPLETIESHAQQMWRKGHLPAVGPTRPHEPFNLTEKTGSILNELEKAHIYIEQLSTRLREQEARLAEAMLLLEELKVERER
jgi:hypothetical protein